MPPVTGDLTRASATLRRLLNNATNLRDSERWALSYVLDLLDVLAFRGVLGKVAMRGDDAIPPLDHPLRRAGDVGVSESAS